MEKDSSLDNLKNILDDIKTDQMDIKEEPALDELKRLKDKAKINTEELINLRKIEKELTIDNEHIKIDQKLKTYPQKTLSAETKTAEKKDTLASRKLSAKIQLELAVSKDELKAYLNITASGENHHINPDQIMEFIKKQGIKYGLLEENISRINNLLKEKKEIKDYFIAEGKASGKGKNAQLIFKIENNNSLAKNYILKKAHSNNITFKNPQEEGEYLKNYSEKNKLIINTIHRRQVIAYNSEQQKGEDGITVMGKPIPGSAGDDLNIEIKRNIKFEQKTGMYMSEIDGLLIFENNSLWCKHYKQGNFKIESHGNSINLSIIPSVGGAPSVKTDDIWEKIKNLRLDTIADKNLITGKINEAENLHQIVNVFISQQQAEKPQEITQEVPKKEIKVKLEIEISDNEMEAYLNIIAEGTGAVVEKNQIIDFIKRNDINFGLIDINIPQINNLLKEMTEINGHMIAKGEFPKKGEDAHLAFKIKNRPDLVEKYILKAAKDNKVEFDTPEAEKKYIQDYIEKNKVIVGIVSRGQIAAHKLNPEDGKDGMTVTGKKIPNERGNDINVRIKRNIKFDPIKQIYTTEIGGMLIFDNYTLWCQMYKQGSFSIKLLDNEMTAELIITPSVGGSAPIKVEDIWKELKKINIISFINEKKILEKIAEAESSHETVSLKIAEGIPPAHGKDAYIEYKIKLATGKQFKKKEYDRIDYKEKDSFTPVKKDQLIAVLHKYTRSEKDGQTVTGKVIEAQTGSELIVETGKNVAAKEYEDKIEFYSEIDGHFKKDVMGLHVLPVFNVDEDVDLSVGNIKFSGDVIVQGSVQDEFSINATGDIVVFGSVGSAFIQSEGNITIKNGFFGKNKGKLICKGDISVKFIENGIIECEQNIIVDREIVNSSIKSNDTIIVTGTKGYIMGGEIYGGRKIVANVIGSKSGVKTTLFLGFNFRIKERIRQIKQKKIQSGFHLNKVETVIGKLLKQEKDITKFNDEMKQIYIGSLQKKIILTNQLKRLRNEEKSINEDEMIINDAPELMVNETLYPDVTIYYLNKAIVISEIYSKVRIGRSGPDKKISIQKLR